MKQNTKKMTLSELIKKGEAILASYNQPDAKIDARLLIKDLLKCDTMTLLVEGNTEVPDATIESYMYFIAKRTQGMPVQYITKEQEFMGLSFYVDERVLIPRQDTETLIEEVIKVAEKEPIHKAVEIGAGSGCISIALAHLIPTIHVLALDISKGALDVAKRNVEAHGLQQRVELLESDIFSNYKGQEGELDLVISNPPYISLLECKELMEEVKRFEPRIALTDEGDGLKFYRVISKEAKRYLKKGGMIAYEIGYNQGEQVAALLQEEGYEHIQVIKDLAKHDRVVLAKNK